jgi:uncharacterized protein (DUF2141 family)
MFLGYILLSWDVTLTVIAKNVQPGKGSVVAEIWNDEKLFLKKPFLVKSLKADHETLKFSFELPVGEYAISVYQDINDNKKLDLGMFHIPKEPVGFGNNFRPKFSAPPYKECAINLTDPTTQDIELK